MSGHTDDNDRVLRQQFDALRDDDREQAPPFAATWARARRRAAAAPPSPARVPWWSWAPAMAALLVAAVIATARHERPAGPLDLSREIALATEISHWQGPTSGLGELADVRVLDASSDLALTSLDVPDDTGFTTVADADRAMHGAAGAASEGNKP